MSTPTPRKLSHYFTASRRKGRDGLPLMSVTMHKGLVRRDELDRKMDSALTPEEHLLVEPNDIAYNTMRMWQGCFGLAEEAANVSPAYVVMRPKDTVDPRFAAHWFKSDRGLYMLWAYSYGLTEDRLRLYGEEFLEIPVVWPDISMQSYVASVIDAWDEVIDTLAKLVIVKKAAEQSLYDQISRQWPKTEIEQFGCLVGGGTPSKNKPEFWVGTIPWVSSKDMSVWWLENTEDSISQSAIDGSATRLVPLGSILMVVRSGILRHTLPIAFAAREVAINQDIKALIPNDGIDSRLLARVLKLETKRIRQLTMKTGTTVESIDINALKEYPLPFPVAEDRETVAALLDATGNEILSLESRLTLLRRQKRGLMQKLLTGEWQVPKSIDRLTPGGDAAVALARKASAA
jgi:type I restriction enzyme S subunit